MARKAANHPWVEPLARLGFVCKGLVYAIVGLLATQAALGAGGEKTDARGALGTIVTQPFGQILLSLVAIGLIGYAFWRVVEAMIDPENKGNGAKGIFQRLGYVGDGLIYAGLAITAVKILIGVGSGDRNQTRDWTALLLAQPFGQWLVGVVGAGVIGFGFYQFYKAYTAKFCRELKLNEMSARERTWITRSGRLGYAARGVVFTIIGLFLIQAAQQTNPNQAIGVGEALEALAQQPYGPWLLGIVAIGLIAYGLYFAVQARYRQTFS
ncbi:MAG: DUF1206 domain-containing protein [Leptolyngbyaceae cyanobacterium RU_5_1]|nr:DUF1206 domain-containing protein [Leptolyngbyaceae cyanobacterium RU_5_1]